DVLTLGDGRKVDLDRGAGRDRRGVRVHLGNEGPERSHSTDGSERSRCHKEEITACRMVRPRRCRHDSKPFLSCSRWNRPGNAQGRCPKKADAQERDQVGLPAPATPAAAEDRLLRPRRPTKQSRIVLLAPLPKERKPTIRLQACNALNPCRPLF